MQFPCFQEAGVFFVVRVGLQLHDHFRTGVGTLTRGHGTVSYTHLVYDITDPKTGELLHAKDVMLREEDAAKFTAHGIDRVYVRSCLLYTSRCV